MDEDFIFQVTEEELAQFPEEEGNREGTERKEQKSYRTSPESRRRNYLTEGKSKYPFPVGFETTQVVCYQQKWPV